MRKAEEKALVIVAGPEGSGKDTFVRSFKNAFLQGYPLKDLYEGINEATSFAAVSTLCESRDLELLERAKQRGYRITLYFLFAPKPLCLVRSRFKGIIDGRLIDESEIKRSYEPSFKGLVASFAFLDLAFLVKNEKEFRFVAAYEPSAIDLASFTKDVKALKAEVEALN